MCVVLVVHSCRLLLCVVRRPAVRSALLILTIVRLLMIMIIQQQEQYMVCVVLPLQQGRHQCNKVEQAPTVLVSCTIVLVASCSTSTTRAHALLLLRPLPLQRSYFEAPCKYCTCVEAASYSGSYCAAATTRDGMEKIISDS